ncbi:probable cytochrome P450 313a4 [Aedes aegypti]|uniref:Uncharacterized protein n=1 Tax=Aedes aegypti TaxID=7159 RepID=A0A1S4FCL9_AEDAE|nr:probable cytochrome P450 313a4 [Aedes aegypti]
MLFALLATGAILSLAVIWSIVQKNRFAQNVPTIEPWYPVVGNGLLFFGKNDIKKFHKLRKAFDRKDALFRLYLGPRMLLCTSDPTVAQAIMTDANCMEKPYVYKFFNLNEGVFAAKTHIWKGQRKALNPAFNSKILESFVSIFCEVSKTMIQRLDTVGKGDTINIMEHASRCTLEMVCSTTLGFNVDIFDQIDDMGHKIEQFFYIAARRILKFYLHVDSIYRWTKDYKDEQTLRENLDVYGMQIYDDANNRFSKGSMNDETDDDKTEGFRKPQIFVNQIFTNTIRKFERQEIIDNIITIVGAGTDTSATAIAFTFLQLAMYQEHQQKVYEEIVKVFPESEPHITTEALKKLQYTKMVLNECLRLYPVAPILLRENTADITLCGGVRVPKGNILTIDVYNIHRRKDVWGPDADEFIPERFSPERSAGRHPFAFLTFSGGSRNCIGSRYAMISMKIMMVYLLKNFRFKTKIREEDIRYKFDALLRIEGGHLVQIEKRA